MGTRNTKHWLAVFFCSAGLVYAGPVAADEGPTSANVEGGEDAVELFSEEKPDELPQGQTVNVGSFGQIDLHVKDLDLTKVLQLLSIQSQRNIIASRNVAGTISADLYGVDFYEALDAILHTNGFGYTEKGQFIYVYTQDELVKIQEAERRPVTRIVRLNYINASDASAFVAPLLSAGGSVSVSGEVSKGYLPTTSDGGANSFAHGDTLVIRDYQENVDEIMAILQELDVRPKQVLVEATILQAKLTEANAFGVDFALFGDLDIGSFTNPLNAVNNIISGGAGATGGNTGGAVTSTPGNVAQGPATVKIGYLGSDAAIFVRALDSVTDTTVMANPKILVLNRQKADLLVGERLGYLSSTATETSTTQSVEFLDVGTQLTLRPFISDDDMIRLELKPSISDGDTELVGGFVIPDETTQELTTNVIVPNGMTVVLGGLFKEDTSIGRRQVPGLGDIPIAGAAFRGQDDTVERSEVIFLVKPTIMKDERLVDMGSKVADDVKLQALGARRGLLPWSKTKLTAGQMRNALRAMETGDKEKALWSVNMALYLDPTMTEALKLKEELTGQKMYYHNFSILEDAINDTIDAQVGEELDAAVEPMGAADQAAEATTELAVDAEAVAIDVPVVETTEEAPTYEEPTVELVSESLEPEFEAGANEMAVSEPVDVEDTQATLNVFDLVGDALPGEAQADVETEEAYETVTEVDTQEWSK